MGSKKIFVLDTNVILHDHSSIYSFREHDVVIPITVLEEVDNFKKGQDDINFHARQFTRELDKLCGDGLFENGVSLGEGRGKLYVQTGQPFSNKMKQAFLDEIPDHRIIAIADYITQISHDAKVILVSKDINLRMKAKAIGLYSEDYETGKVVNISKIQTGVQAVENASDEFISQLYKAPFQASISDSGIENLPKPNDYIVLKGANTSVLSYFNSESKMLERVNKQTVYGIEPRNAEQTFALHALLNPNIPLIAITGKAGTGKTLLALAAALAQEKHFSQVLLARPIVALGNKDLGFLPGSEKDKIRPYMQPLFDNLNVIKAAFNYGGEQIAKVEKMLLEERLVISPLAYIRGRSLSDVYFIIDEAQNLTPHEVKTIITRAGKGTKIVFTGDIEQIDSPYLDTLSNGLSHLTAKMKGQKLFTHVNLMKGERSELAELASDLL